MIHSIPSNSFQQFVEKLQSIDTYLGKGNVSKDALYKVSEFIENNKNLLVQDKRAAILLDSIGVKLCKGNTNDSLISKLKGYVELLIPSDQQKIKSSLQFFRDSIRNPSKRLQSIADWITLIKIPLGNLDLSEEELAGLLVRLEHIELTNFNFESYDLRLLTEHLLKPDVKFKTKDAIALRTLAFICAKENTWDTARWFKNFEIGDPFVRVDIARFCAMKDGMGTAFFIKNFNIHEQTIRAEIACLCSKQDTWSVVSYIKHFEIEDTTMLTEIASLCAKQNGEKTAYFIQNFEIKDPNVRIEIARLCAFQDAKGTARYIKKFQIEDPGVRAEIAGLCARRNGVMTAYFIKNFEILNHKDRQELFYQCTLSAPESLFYLKNFSLDTEEFFEISRFIEIFKSKTEESLPGEFFNVLDLQIQKLPLSEHCRQILINTSQEIQLLPQHAQNVLGLWFQASILTMGSQKTEVVEWVITQGIWKELALLRDPGLRVLLTRGLYELGDDNYKRKTWEIFLSSVRGIEGQKSMMLLAIPFFTLQKLGLQEERLIKIATTLAEYQKEKKSQLRSVYHIKNILYTLHMLASREVYSLKEKEAGLEKMFSSSSEKRMIKNMLEAKGLLQLKDLDWPTSSEDLSIVFSHSLQKVIPLKNCHENVSEKYNEMFGLCHNSVGLLTYAAGLKALADPEVMICLGNYVDSVLDGTFKEKRYETKHNPHLAKILEFDPSLLKEWKEDLSFDLQTLKVSESHSMVFNPTEWLKMKLLTKGQLGDMALTFFNRYLREDSDKKVVFQELIAEINVVRKEKEKAQLKMKIKESKKSLKTLEGENLRAAQQEQTKIRQELNSLNKQVSEDSILAQLKLEKACLNLIQKGQGIDENTLIDLLKEIEKALKQETTPNKNLAESEFAKEIKGLIDHLEKELNSKEKRIEGLKVLFTDDPMDLLLCGIGDSCQRLDGNPNLNKGLLGYLVDGKNRLLVIKEGNKIIARCILRLLWDGVQPVIYRETFYPKTIPTDYRTVLNVLAKKVATKLNMPLTSNDPGIPYGKKLEALGGPAPYEYSNDSGNGGIQKSGRYVIQEAKQIL